MKTGYESLLQSPYNTCTCNCRKKSLKNPTHTHKRVVGCLGVLEAMKKGINLYDKLQAQ